MKKLFFILLCLSLGVATQSTSFAEGNRQKLKDTYSSQLGVTELTGNNDGVEVEKYLASVGLGKGYAWCAAFVTYCFREAGYQVPSLPMAAQWLIKSKRVAADELIPTDLFGVYYGRTVRHVGFVDRIRGNKLFTVEGNTNNNGSREGIGVFRRIRLKNSNLVYSRWT